MTVLSNTSIPEIANAPNGVAVPKYDRRNVQIGIVHFGVGGFHRAHEALVIDTVMNNGAALEWGICGVGVMEADHQMRDVLLSQDGLYTMVVKHADGGREARVIGSIVDYLFAPDDPDRVIERLANPDTKIVSLTVTEGGYNFDPATGEFNAKEAGVVADLETGAIPRTIFGLITEGLARRRSRGIVPFTVMSCDNLQSNGDVAKRMFSAFARLKDPELGAWVEESVSFPNSMVDRITPVTTEDDVKDLSQDFGVEDRWPVVCEPFFQWALEDNFTCGRPPVEGAGVQVVPDVEPYELMKLRLLNAGHQAIAYTGHLMGHRYAHEAASDPLIAAFARRYMDREATPTLHPVPGVDLDDYKSTLIERFSNAEVRDTIARLCADSSNRIPKWLVPVIRDRLADDGDVTLSATIVASWVRYAWGVDEQGEPIEIVDAMRDTLLPLAQRQQEDPLAFVSVESLFGDIAQDPRFAEPYVAALESFHRDGVAATLKRLLQLS